jgi:hypothetical protein
MSRESRRPSAFCAVPVLVGAFLLFLVLPHAAAVLRAARPEAGTPGVFTAERLDCVEHPGHSACGWQGGFRSDDGSVVRARTSLYGGQGALRAGAGIRARDIGRAGRVYRFEGSREWVLNALLAGVGAVLVLGGLSPVVRTRRSRLPKTSLVESSI